MSEATEALECRAIELHTDLNEVYKAEPEDTTDKDLLCTDRLRRCRML